VIVGPTKCLVCEDTGWVCETHPDQPWQGPHACACGGAGAPCPRSNACIVEERFRRGSSPMASKGLRQTQRSGPSATGVWGLGPLLEMPTLGKSAHLPTVTSVDRSDRWSGFASLQPVRSMPAGPGSKLTGLDRCR